MTSKNKYKKMSKIAGCFLKESPPKRPDAKKALHQQKMELP